MSKKWYEDRVGVWRAAELLTARLGFDVTVEAVEELARREVIGYAGTFRRTQMFSLADVEACDAGAAKDAEETAGGLLNRPKAVRRLGIRAADFDRLVACGFIPVAKRVRFAWGLAPLYRTADLDEFAARADIDWAAVQSTPPGKLTPLYDLCLPELILQALGGPRRDR